MRETFTSGSVGRAPGNRCLYPEGDGLQLPLRFSFQPRLTLSVMLVLGAHLLQFFLHQKICVKLMVKIWKEATYGRDGL